MPGVYLNPFSNGLATVSHVTILLISILCHSQRFINNEIALRQELVNAKRGVEGSVEMPQNPVHMARFKNTDLLGLMSEEEEEKKKKHQQQKPAARQVTSGWQVALAFEVFKAQCLEIATLVEESGDLEAATFGEVSG